jgi:uncharacterized protein CbrC (UPF0167 family)
MPPTFADLAIPFPLFEAPAEEAPSHVGEAACSLCRQAPVHCFRLGIGADVVVACERCGAETGIDADDRAEACRACGVRVTLPHTDPELRACHRCLRAGRAAITHDTRFGMVSWELAVAGRTHGRPAGGLDQAYVAQFETSIDEDSGWLRAHLDPSWLLDLVRTPTYSTWQGEQWELCCRRPMVYLGRWGRDDFDRHAPDGDGHALCSRAMAADGPDPWQHLGRSASAGGVSAYVFRCPACGAVRGHWDID